MAAAVVKWQTAAVSITTDYRQAAIGWFRASNGSHYGLLGADFSPGSDGQLRVEISASSPLTDQAWSLPDPPLAPFGRTRIGLPGDLAGAIVDAVPRSTAGVLLGAGTLRFSHAAYNDVSSHLNEFGLLTCWVIRLLAHASPTSTRTELEELFVLTDCP